MDFFYPTEFYVENRAPTFSEDADVFVNVPKTLWKGFQNIIPEFRTELLV
jgi:hypothetical protein